MNVHCSRNRLNAVTKLSWMNAGQNWELFSDSENVSKGRKLRWYTRCVCSWCGGNFKIQSPFWYSGPFGTGEIIFFVLSVRSQNKTFVDFIHKFISLKTEEQLFKPIQWLCLKSCVPRPFLNQVIATWKWRNVQCNFQIFWAYIYKYSYSQRPNPGLIPAPCFNDTPDNLLSQPR